MRQTAKKLVDAYNAGKNRGAGNSCVSTSDGVTTFSLHGNPIVRVDGTGRRVISVSFAGWPTNTTRSRINDICCGLYGGRPVSQMNFDQYVLGYGKVQANAGLWYQVYPAVEKA